MPRIHRSLETIIYKLREAEILISQGKTVKKASKQIGLMRHENLSPGELADRLGYRSEAAFSRAFIRFNGLSSCAARPPLLRTLGLWTGFAVS